MIRRIISTTASRLLIALANLAIVWLSARSLGAEGMGTISLIILGISINQMISALVGGSALVYLVPRHPLRQLLMPAWIWAIMVSAGGSFLLGLFDLVPAEYITDLFWISLLQSYFTINQNVLLGKEKVFHFNLMAVIQVLLVLISLGILFAGFSVYTVKSYVIALYISYGIVFLISDLLIFKYIGSEKWWNGYILKEAFRFGGYLQAASFHATIQLPLKLLHHRESILTGPRWGCFRLVCRFRRVSGSSPKALPWCSTRASPTAIIRPIHVT
jgi:O-antigen/teichoic acid export membrane protein